MPKDDYITINYLELVELNIIIIYILRAKILFTCTCILLTAAGLCNLMMSMTFGGRLLLKDFNMYVVKTINI